MTITDKLLADKSAVPLANAIDKVAEMLQERDKIAEMLKERKNQHGDFTDQARTAQRLKWEMRNGPNWPDLTPTQQEGLDMIQHKIARILAGDPHFPDHWDDIIGYARITRDRLGKV